MKTLTFASRSAKEILRDKLNLAFGLGFPLILLLLLSLIQSNVPVPLFEIQQLTPGVAAFALSFISLFSGMLIAKDRTGSLMLRLFTSPMRAGDFILGYCLPLLPIAFMQTVICFAAAFFFGLKPSANVLLAIVVTIPTAILFIAIGLLCGSLFNDKQVGGICGALLTNVSAWLSGTWFDVELVGGVFKTIANCLPFVHAVNAGRYALNGEYAKIMPDLWWVIGYAIAILFISVLVFNRKVKNSN